MHNQPDPILAPVESLYVHVPFCAKKCAYCAFYSKPGDAAAIDRYVQALVRELEMQAGTLRPRTIFFGGGTPSLLDLSHWDAIAQALHRLDLSGLKEWTVECNPATVSPDKAQFLRQAGVNRISMGVQSFDPAMLTRLGRVHTREAAFESFDILRAAGFENIGIDLMFAIPGQTMQMWRRTLDEASALGVEHLSCYELIYEEDTPFFCELGAGPDEAATELACSMYEELLSHTSASGFAQYEVANFARLKTGESGEIPMRACHHNVNYWRGGDYLGLGPSATSYIDGARFKNLPDTPAWCEAVERGGRALESSETLEPQKRAGELAAFGLRMNAGWPLELFRQRAGYDLEREWPEEIRRLIALDYAVLEPGRFRLTQRGMRYADWAAELFLR